MLRVKLIEGFTQTMRIKILSPSYGSVRVMSINSQLLTGPSETNGNHSVTFLGDFKI